MKKTMFILLISSLSVIVNGQDRSPAKSYCDSIFKEITQNLIVEALPVYPGGVKAMNQFISDNLNISVNPDTLKGKIQGMLNIDANGHIKNACVYKVISGRKSSMDATPLGIELLRIIQMMPDWTPAMQNGKNIRVKHFLIDIPLK